MKIPVWMKTELKHIGLENFKFNLEMTDKFISEYDPNNNTVYISKHTSSGFGKLIKKLCARPTDPKHSYRHEIGHAFLESMDHVKKTKRFKRVFGSTRTRYDERAILKAWMWKDIPDEYVSKYAQAHPEEDFAETFAEYLVYGVYKDDPYWVKEKKKYIDDLISRWTA